MSENGIPKITIGPDKFEISVIGLGMMGLAGTWNPDEVGPQNIENATNAFAAALETGINFFDHADIYGRGACESVFKSCMENIKPSRESLFIASKCGIVLESDSVPYHYDLSFLHIMQSVQQSLERMGLDYLDLYQIHRRDPMTHPAETALALNRLMEQGLIKNVGVSNYNPAQTRVLEKYLEKPIISIQPEFSLLHLNPIYDGILDYCEETNVSLLAYSPIAKGLLAGKPAHEEASQNKLAKLWPVLDEIAKEKEAVPFQIALAWLMHNPANVIPIYGSNNPEHITEAVNASRISLEKEEWYRLWSAARSEPLP